MAYDGVRGRVVAFGGDGSTFVSGATWELDVSTGWRLLIPAAGPAPAPRAGHCVAYDAGRRRLVLFGGAAPYPVNEVWEYDGIRWSEGPRPPHGTGDVNAMLAYDATRRKIVKVAHAAYYLQEAAWEYDGTSWSAGPPAPGVDFLGASMAFDPARDRMVIYGGYLAGNTVEYDGATWTTSWLGGPPAYGFFPSMSYQEANQRVVLFGGGAYNPPSNDTWFYDGTAWSQGPATPPGLVGRDRLAMAYDTPRGRVILFGGRGRAGLLNDTWGFDQGWSSGAAAPASLTRRDSAAMDYDATTGGMVLFGGSDATGRRGDTWHYQCLDVAPGALPNAEAGIAYDQQLTATGGGTATFAVTVGAPPPGLTLSPSGRMSGVPTAAGGYELLVRAIDGSGCAGSQVYTMVVGPVVDYVVGQGLGPTSPNRVRVFDAAGTPTVVDFLAYAAGGWGTVVAGADVDSRTSRAEIVTGPGPGAVFGPHVRAFDATGTSIPPVSFYAYGTLRYGANVAAGAIAGRANAQILTGAGPGRGFGAHVRGFDFDGGRLVALPKVNFFAYSTPEYGVDVTTADVDADGFAEVLTGPGPGPGFAPTVRGFDYDGGTLAAMARINFQAFQALGYGVHPAGGDTDADGHAEIVAAPGAGPSVLFPARYVGFDYDGGPVTPLEWLDVTPYPSHYGGRASLADIAPDGHADLLVGAGPDPLAESSVLGYDLSGASLRPIGGPVAPYGTAFGATVAGAALGW